MIATDFASPERTLWIRVRRFVQKPWPEKGQVAAFHFKRIFQALPLPTYLPFGAWWLTFRDAPGNAILGGSFESVECGFVEDLLQTGMTVLDIGAHHGLYTLIASRRVGPRGQVIAFEPSPREKKRLARHVRLNICRNVRIEDFALGDKDGEADFFVVDSNETGCNSLRPPDVQAPTRAIRVRVVRLDDFLQAEHIERVDFIKMDVEGAELAVLRGARRLLERRPRPPMLVEVSDLRTQPWGYRAREIVSYLREMGYQWFQPVSGGYLATVDMKQQHFDNNFVALPEERLQENRGRIEPDGIQACQSFD